VVCSDSDETPDALRLEADLVVDGPPGVVAFLDALAAALSA
jgi:trehalose 6-phosphate phosphatase